jgi:hypothetical protein
MEYKCDIKFMGVPSRMSNIAWNVSKLGLSMEDVFLDREYRRCPILSSFDAFNLPFKDDSITHRLVLQDDVEIADGLKDFVNYLVNLHPNAIWSLMIFTKKKFDIPKGSIVKVGERIYGLAVIIPKRYIKMIQSSYYETTNSYKHDDAFYATFAKYNKIDIYTTYPNVVEHLGVGSINSELSHAFKWRSMCYINHPIYDLEWHDRPWISLGLSVNDIHHYKEFKKLMEEEQ